MAMRVKELIKQLKKYPSNSYVGIQAHDNYDNELQMIVDSVWDFDPDNSFDKKYCDNVYVVLT